MNKEILKKRIAEFKWESKEQKEGYLAFMKYQTDHSQDIGDEVDLAVAFLIQKNHEQNQYLIETIAGQVEALQNDVKKLMDNS